MRNFKQPFLTSKKKIKSSLLLGVFLVLILFSSSCVKHTQLLYFRNQTEFVPLQNHDIVNQIRVKIQPDDLLFIQVKSLDQETADPFNLFSAGSGLQMSAQINPTLQGYLVDSDGNIDFPVLGRLNVAAKTVEEAKALLSQKLSAYLKDPVIIMRFVNFRLTVLGEVNAPRTISVPGERITILEAIGQAGDLTAYSNREKIMVIREQNSKREFGYVNIHSPEVFQSPYFYLQQNDIVYVEPIAAKTADVRDPISEILPLVSGAISIAALLIAFIK
jgi:polysaccharide export outer membrane protein